ncbi:mucin-2-like [Ptychodera flava]|uniref:mucin-2-like n=1 Tax=Ptychodera flava TaxID=63121 RepID=UPI00396A0921
MRKNSCNRRRAIIWILLLLLWPVCAQDIENRNGELFQWTEWMDDENGGPIDPSSIGEFEILSALEQQYDFCDDFVDIECRLISPLHTPFDETGQVSLTCNIQTGFLCFHSQQSGDCFNYEIRVLCPLLLQSTHQPTTMPSKTTQPVTQDPVTTEQATSPENDMVTTIKPDTTTATPPPPRRSCSCFSHPRR